ncbi:protease II [Fontibacillus solani]|uniref:Protease II n=1 Tax=Fontibacillus solani TaxID=1572857 RepID=A0A7W3SUS2_9BACL|nr:SLATT domain-containing protein [Fontibacillus solani]MBA9086592.1 protease II [Fontibacillus solani]
MDRSSRASQGYKLESQIREAYGRIVYTFTCHNKIVQRMLSKNEKIKLLQIVLSALTTGGFIVAIIADEKIASILGAFVSVSLLILNAYTKNFDLVETAQSHQKAADALWVIREEYVSLLTDFELLDDDAVMAKRSELQNRSAEVYAQSPRTDSKSYVAAQRALKTEEEQTFHDDEIDVMLPNSIRRKNRSWND